MRIKQQMLKRVIIPVVILIFIMNVVAFLHAYKFTHFSSSALERTKNPEDLTVFDKVGVLLTGIDNPKPTHKTLPVHKFNLVRIQSDVSLEAWHITMNNAKGTVILFHGYSGEKSALITRAEEFLRLGYNTFLVDFRGSGGSGGNSTSIGFSEAIEVRDCYQYVQRMGEVNIHLFGTSMGAAAILKSIHDYGIEPSSIMLECPFGSLYQTVCARFRMMDVPTFPMAGLLTFWGGVQQGYWAFAHNPQDYAQSVTCPTLLLFGEKDDRVSIGETMSIYANLKGPKVLKTYPQIGHQIFVNENVQRWTSDVSDFLEHQY